MRWDLGITLREIVTATSISGVGLALTTQIGAARSVALARVWILRQDGGLELVASAGTPSGGGSYNRLDGEFREMAVADGTIADIVEAGVPFVVRGIRGDEGWLTNPSWAARQAVRAFLGVPLLVSGTVVGVLVIFDRETPTDDLIGQLQLAADIAAARVTDLRARARAAETALPTPVVTAVVTRADIRRLEKDNIEAALARTGGKVFGDDGAAALLGMRPTTLASRIKALGISR